MSLQSMTGFGRGESQNDSYTLTVDIKSVNHRFKDTRFKMSSLFAPLEMEFKKSLQNSFNRGSFDIFVNYKKSTVASKEVDIDEEKVAAYINKMNEISKKCKVELELSPTEFLRQEFYIERDEKAEQEMFQLAKEAFEKAVENLSKSRSMEGEKLLAILKEHKNQYEDHYNKICKLLPDFQKSVEEKLRKKFTDIQSDLNIDEPRFLQEVIYYLEKLDVSEEVNRIKVHLEKLESLLEKDREVGRQIDFLVQELGRETNTIGSKSAMNEVSESVVQMKVQLEKIREQGLNLE